MKGSIGLIVLALVATTTATADTRVERSYCASAFDFASADKAREHLLLAAKAAAVDAIFGQFVSSTTVVSNSVLTSDNIAASSVGLIRIEGTPLYSNGHSFGELCVTVAASASDEEFAQFNEVPLKKRDCLGDSELTTGELIEEARVKARLTALTSYEPKLAGYPRSNVLRLLRNIRISEEGFVPETTTYCVTLEGNVTPIEVTAFLETFAPEPPPDTPKYEQWVSSVLGFSSEYGQGWEASTLIGPPNVSVKGCQSARGSWAALKADLPTEFLHVGFNEAVIPQSIAVHQNVNPGSIRQIEFFGDGRSTVIDVQDESTDCLSASVFDVAGKVDFPVDNLRIVIDGKHESGWEEVDAIKLIGFRP